MKLRDVFNEVNRLSNLHWSEAEDYLLSIGAKFLSEGAFSRAFALDLEWGRVVVKFAANDYGEQVNQLEQSDRKEFPLLWRRYVKPLFASSSVVIQPWVETYTGENEERFRNAARVLNKWLYKLYADTFDAHWGNLGFYRGRMMIFDPLVEGRQTIPGDYSNSYRESY